MITMLLHQVALELILKYQRVCILLLVLIEALLSILNM